ncbi:class II SORL domain-containing protein [Synergistaceae bacterium OttesenSCG-928-D05]|nr:class II SORL domain-containing protein [Synergistaceae bacterium OttesenSCG-928-D05]
MIGEFVQSGDYKGEKHVPVIEAPAKVKAGEKFQVQVSVGKEIPHPNKMEHHISWIQLYFKPADTKFLIELADFQFTAHGAAMDPTAVGPAHCEPIGTAAVKLAKSGTLYALSYCNLHGLWESSQEITVE